MFEESETSAGKGEELPPHHKSILSRFPSWRTPRKVTLPERRTHLPCRLDGNEVEIALIRIEPGEKEPHTGYVWMHAPELSLDHKVTAEMLTRLVGIGAQTRRISYPLGGGKFLSLKKSSLLIALRVLGFAE